MSQKPNRLHCPCFELTLASKHGANKRHGKQGKKSYRPNLLCCARLLGETEKPGAEAERKIKIMLEMNQKQEIPFLSFPACCFHLVSCSFLPPCSTACIPPCLVLVPCHRTPTTRPSKLHGADGVARRRRRWKVCAHRTGPLPLVQFLPPE